MVLRNDPTGSSWTPVFDPHVTKGNRKRHVRSLTWPNVVTTNTSPPVGPHEFVVHLETGFRSGVFQGDPSIHPTNFRNPIPYSFILQNLILMNRDRGSRFDCGLTNWRNSLLLTENRDVQKSWKSIIERYIIIIMESVTTHLLPRPISECRQKFYLFLNE